MERDRFEFLSFRLSNELFGIDLRSVREVVKALIRPDERFGAAALGVVELRSLVIPVADLKGLFSLGAADGNAPGGVIIAAAGGRVIGLAVDEVLDVERAISGPAARQVRERVFSSYLIGEADFGRGRALIIAPDAVGASINLP